MTSGAGPVRIVLVDDHEMVIEGLKAMLAAFEDRVQVVGQAVGAERALSVVDELKPDIVLCDVRMQGSSGLDLCLELRERDPERKVVMLSVYDDEQYLFQALRVGASGYLLKSISSDELVRQLEFVHRGQTAIDPGMAARAADTAARLQRDEFWPGARQGLTQRESEILSYVVNGLSNRGIATKLVIGDETVKSHLGRSTASSASATAPARSPPHYGKAFTSEPTARVPGIQRGPRSRRRRPRTRAAARADPGGLQRPGRGTAGRRGGADDHRRHRERRLLRARARRHRAVADAGRGDAAVRQRGRQDPAAAGSGHLGLGGQPPRTGGDQPRQGVRSALHAVRVATRLGLHVDGVGADGDRPRRAGRRAERAHRPAARVHRARRRTAAGDRPADRRCAAPGPAAPPAGGPRTRARELRRAGDRGPGDRATSAGRRHPRRHLAAARHAVVSAGRGDPGGRRSGRGRPSSSRRPANWST